VLETAEQAQISSGNILVPVGIFHLVHYSSPKDAACK